MKRHSLLILLALGAFGPGAEARIGETPTQCAERYGLKLATPTNSANAFWAREERYEKNGIRLAIRYLKDENGTLHAGCIEYKAIKPKETPISEVQTKALLANVASDWTPLALLPPPPPPPTNTPPEAAKGLARTSKVKVISLEKISGAEEQRLKKEQEAQRAKVQEIEAHNREVTQLKARFLRMAVAGTNLWTSSEAVAAGSPAVLTLISREYLEAYDQHEAREEGHRERAAATPLKGF